MHEEKEIPLCGLIELLAAARLLGDTDALGIDMSNAGRQKRKKEPQKQGKEQNSSQNRNKKKTQRNKKKQETKKIINLASLFCSHLTFFV